MNHQQVVDAIEEFLDYVASRSFRRNYPEISRTIIRMADGYSQNDPTDVLMDLYRRMVAAFNNNNRAVGK